MREPDARRDPVVTSTLEAACGACVQLIEQGCALIRTLSDDEFNACAEPDGWASSGAHLRHVIDYFDLFFTGLDVHRIDYTARARRADVEQSRAAALHALERCIEGLGKIEKYDPCTVVEVRCEEGESFVDSTVARELRSIASHTTHHYALIRLTLARRGIATDPDLGVSPSTLAHRKRIRATRS